jgi:hypothetical protein
MRNIPKFIPLPVGHRFQGWICGALVVFTLAMMIGLGGRPAADGETASYPEVQPEWVSVEQEWHPVPEVNRRNGKRVYHITRVEGGSSHYRWTFDDESWAQGTWEGGFLQREPIEGAEPPDPTEFKLLYDDQAIYVAIRAFVKDVANAGSPGGPQG